ncbi:putative integral membrane protein [Phaeoacremonium minimum UCRPA7]|uniref:Putative integral membrane protein n=1 Tax=Phaeoacremonium minimum (strain UCR-PA7) TaxID=1286976 RepID=R8B8T1_PHAM7|nr:putative integral membrane protein [Phaeoacremonium minimum UCRPA7]EON95703.1 putative integral membrane protein [Phaeoacremonium minimum UCRPA7]
MRISYVHALFWIVWLFLLIFSYFNSYDDPSSIFYDTRRAYEQRFSLVRSAEADQFLKQPSGVKSSASQKDKLLCIGIPSVNRTSESFLSHTVATLTDTLTPDERKSVHIVVLLADKSPQAHFAYGQKWLDQIVDEVLVYDTESTPSNISDVYRTIPFNVYKDPRGDGRVENMRLDHSVLVETCRNYGSPYFALVEDDIVASRDWFRRFKKGLAYTESQSEKTQTDWMYLRLFYSEIFMGWNSEEWLTYSETIFLVYVVILALFLEARRRWKFGARSGASAAESNILAAAVFGLWIPAMIVLYFMAGRVSVNRLIPWPNPGAREMERYGCCAQGLVIPERHLEGFQNLLRNPPYDFAGDQKLEGYAESRGLRKWALEPSVFQHVGLKQSSAGDVRAEVWNFSFERQHKR